MPRAKTFQVILQKPGSLPEKVRVTEGTTLKKFSEKYEIGDYLITVNGGTATGTHELKKGDIVRIGVKTKNG